MRWRTQPASIRGAVANEAQRRRHFRTVCKKRRRPAAQSVGTYDRYPEPMPPAEPIGRDQFENVTQNVFKIVREAPVSTFSIDVDTASYSFVRGQLNQNVLPQADAVRTEELINYFPYDYKAPSSADQPFSTNVSVFPSPWAEGRKLVRIGIKGYEVQAAHAPARQSRLPDR